MGKYGFILLLFQAITMTAQVDTLVPDATDLLENAVEDAATEDFEDNSLFDILEALRQNPLDLNQATEEELTAMRLLTPLQIRHLLDYRQKLGDLTAIYELQAVPGFDLETIRKILPFVQVSGDINDFHISRKRLLTHGQNQMLFRFNRTFPKRRGFLPKADTIPAVYQGRPNRYYFRYRYQFGNRLSYGITAENDAGEPFFKGINRYGFDFYSVHFFAHNLHPFVRTLALGDYRLNLGQGLIYYSGFAPGKSAYVTSIRRSDAIIKPFASVREAGFLRGAATTLRLGSTTDLTAFVSLRKNDATLLEPDSLDPENQVFVSSILQSGLHRTANEIAHKNAIRSTVAGIALRQKGHRWHLSFNSLYERLSRPVQRRPNAYSQFYFQGDRLWNQSLDYSVTLSKWYLFGESALDRSGHWAQVAGLLTGLNRYTDLAVLYRNFPKGYEALHPAAFAETSGAHNEEGLYLGLDIHPVRKWTVSIYSDVWRHKWLRYKTTAPSYGNEFFVRVRYSLRRNLECYVQARQEVKETDFTGAGQPVRPLGKKVLHRYRIHLSKKLSRHLELRTRAEWSHLILPGNALPQRGFLLFQDVIYKPWEKPLSLTARMAVFDTDSYASGIYAYENNMLYTFSIPAYYEQGWRAYVNLRYRPVKAWTFEMRWAMTFLQNKDSSGSGNDLIDSRLRTDVGLQVRYSFGKRY